MPIRYNLTACSFSSTVYVAIITDMATSIGLEKLLVYFVEFEKSWTRQLCYWCAFWDGDFLYANVIFIVYLVLVLNTLCLHAWCAQHMLTRLCPHSLVQKSSASKVQISAKLAITWPKSNSAVILHHKTKKYIVNYWSS